MTRPAILAPPLGAAVQIIRYVVIHLDLVPAERRARILAMAELPPGVALAADAGAHGIYTIEP